MDARRNATAPPAAEAAGAAHAHAAIRMPEAVHRLWPVDLHGGNPRVLTLETLREVAMPGGEVPLRPGELFFGGAPARLATLLGACVSVTAWHPRLHVGGLCHYLVPAQPHPGPRPDGRFGEEALSLLAGAIAGTGLRLDEFELKLFGGGGVLGAGDDPRVLDIGADNVRCARAWAAANGLAIAAAHTGGGPYRRISFDLDTGVVDVWCSHSVSLAWASAAERTSL